MCLLVKKGERYRIAKEDIPCYKVVKKLNYRIGYSDDTFYVYCSPYQTRKIFNDEVEGKIPYCANSKFNRGYISNGHRGIGEGAVHTYVNPYNLATPISYELNTLEEFKCVIPKGTKYYVGKDQTGRDSYASERIIFREKIS
jgi:hypothetical protein